MSKLSKKLKSFLENNLLVIYGGTIVVLVGVVWSVFDAIYDLREQELQLKSDKAINLLDEERSRIRIKLDGKVDYLDVDDIFVDGAKIPNSYSKLKSSPFAIPNFSGSENWKWKETNSYEVLKDMDRNNLMFSNELDEIFKLDKFHSYEKNESYQIGNEGKKIYLRPYIRFQFTSKNDFQEIYDSFKELSKESAKNGKKEISVFDLELDKKTMFNVFFNAFTLEKETRVSDYFGKLNESEYYFDRNKFLISGYYDFPKDLNNKIEKLYLLRMGFLRDEGIYLVQFHIPIKEDYEELKIFNTIIHGFKIVK